MTPFNYLLANQSFTLQFSPPNKKARYHFTGRSPRVTKTSSQKLLSVESGKSVSQNLQKGRRKFCSLRICKFNLRALFRFTGIYGTFQ
jgi:hypothetical protein